MQFEFPGTIAVPDGSYLARDASARQSVLVVETLGAPPPPSRRRRRAADTPAREVEFLPLSRATVVRAWEPFELPAEAARWLEETASSSGDIQELIGDGIALLNRALHARAVAEADARFHEEGAGRAVTVRVGYGTGEEVSAGRFSVARDVDVGGRTSRGARREDELRPQERIAAVLAGREVPDASETLMLRVRAELDAGRAREAAMLLPAALRAVSVELENALVDPGHTADLEALRARTDDAEAAARASLRGGLDAPGEQAVRELTELAERVLRRRRLRRG